MDQARLSVEILAYDNDGVKEVIDAPELEKEIGKGIEKKLKKNKLTKPLAGVNKVIAPVIVGVLKGMTSEEGMNTSRVFLKTRPGQKLAVDKLTKAINKNLSKALGWKEKEERKHFLSIGEIAIDKQKGEQAMRLEVELTDLNLTDTLDIVLAQLKKQQTEKRRSKLEALKSSGDTEAAQKLESGDVLKSEQKLMFDVMGAVNKGVDDDQKFKLLQSIVFWASENGLADIVLTTLGNSGKDMGEMIQKMQLKVGEIVLKK